MNHEILAHQERLLEQIDQKLEHQNHLLESFAQAFFAAQGQQEEVLAKLLGEGGPDPLEESMNAAERMRSGILRSMEE